MSAPEVFIALPVFQGREVVAQTLRSIREQSFASYRVLISVDANDTDSVKACRHLTADPRVTLVVQPKRLGWAGNLNWLIERCDCPFFCYWQQDDLTQANYLEVLHAEMTAYPDTAIAYADVQWFGSRSYRDSCAGIHGPAAQRVLQAIEAIRYEPLRGLIRAEFLPRHEAIAITGDNSCHMEFPFMAGLAARGAFRRVGGTLYYKRAHRQSISEAWNRWPPWRRRRAWIDMGLGFFRVAQEAVPDPAYRRQLLATIIDRLAIARLGRGFFYEPEPQSLEWIARFTRDLVARGNLATPRGDPAPAPDPGAAPFFRPIHPHVEAALDAESRRQEALRTIGIRLQREGEITLETRAAGEGLALLGFGWSVEKEGGVALEGDEASLSLPPAGPGPWRIMVHGHHAARNRAQRGRAVQLRWRVGLDEQFRSESVNAGEDLNLELPLGQLASGESGTASLQIRAPDSVLLPSEGVGEPRGVGFRLRSIRFARCEETGGRG